MVQMQHKVDQRLWESQTSSLESVFCHPNLLTVAGFVHVFFPLQDKNEIYSDHVSPDVSVQIAVLAVCTERWTLCSDTARSHSFNQVYLVPCAFAEGSTHALTL